MNPPQALYGAMSRDRKPFTYTPGGLDLSEIKSERMAKRLMRNAMNQGVPEVPIHQIQSPPANSNAIVVPNFNCLPVQVFPTLNLPANPKSLLRTRSNPEHPREPPAQRLPQQSQISKPKIDTSSAMVSQKNNNSSNYHRPLSMYEHSSNTLPRIHHASNDDTESFLPEISYDAEYFQTAPRYYPEGKSATMLQNKCDINSTKTTSEPHAKEEVSKDQNKSIVECNITEKSASEVKNDCPMLTVNQSVNNVNPRECELGSLVFKESEVPYNTELNHILKKEDIISNLSVCDANVRSKNVSPLFSDSFVDPDFSIEPLSVDSHTPILIKTKPLAEESRPDTEQKEVKVVKKQVKKENKTEVHNGDQNGDASVEAELTVKLPSKKSAAKTETKVEVVKKHLPDGSIEEVKTTTTKTTVDGKTTISTKTETTIIPKEEEEEVEVEEEEEENEEVEINEVEESGENEVVVKESVEKTTEVEKPSTTTQNGNNDSIIAKQERSETQIIKKVTVTQNQEPEEVEEEVEEEEEEEIEETKPVVIKKESISKQIEKEEEIEQEESQAEDEVEDIKQEKLIDEKEVKVIEESEVEEEEEEIVEKSENNEEKQKTIKEENNQVENADKEEEEDEVKDVKKEEVIQKNDVNEDVESEYTEEEYESEKEEELIQAKTEVEKPKSEAEQQIRQPEQDKSEPKEKESKPEPPVEAKNDEQKTTAPKVEEKTKPEQVKSSEPTIPLREPSIPLEKVEDVEIKPISLSGAPLSESITKTVTKNTEITTSERPSGPLSTQTEYNRVENIVTVNRTTKTLDHTYEEITQHGTPTVKTYFAPSRERVSTSPQPSKPYQPVYPPTVNPPTERRHSLLLERLSTERQLPSTDIYQNYQYNTQSYEQQKQWSQEPQAEVVTDSNVKPSKITNQQWYQNKDTLSYNNVTPTTPASQIWNQPSFQPQPSPQPPSQPQPQYKPSYTETNTNTYQQNNYHTYPPKPTSWGTSNVNNTDTLSSSINTQQNQYSYLNQNSSQLYQKPTQQYSSSYVPPPWEQDASYVADISSQIQYQPPTSTTTFTSNTSQGWNPPPPKSKFTKTPPKSYIPPAPNQSFVKPVNTVEPPRVAGKKTYYSEYERRYITVPESTYVPGETKYQPQPDPSPQYYYDNNEPVESVEPQWRKELREFTEKTSQTQQTEQVSVQPPWEEESKYAKAPSASYTPTPSWSQTLRPRSWRERSFESEYVGSQETQKTNTLGRGRPLSSYGQNQIETIPERPRGVSVDRYNPNNYQSPMPAEYPPVQTHILNVVPPAKSYHNPNVPAYHASRASAEPREQPVTYQQPRQWGESRASPIQSRSFKYLQWITGTEN